jgi:hypothetical protein
MTIPPLPMRTVNPRAMTTPSAQIERSRYCRASGEVTLFYNWWTIFVRLVEPSRHMETMAAAVARRHTGAACEANNNHRREFTREEFSRREGFSCCRHFSARARKRCGAVDELATLAANPRESLPRLPSRPPIALAATPCALLTQHPLLEKTEKSAPRPRPTAGFRMTCRDCMAAFFGLLVSWRVQ